VYGQEFDLPTDNSALTWLLSFKNLEGKTASWIQRLQKFKFTSEHRQGRKHNNVAALSRRPCQECTHCHKLEQRAEINQVGAISAVAAAGWDQATLRTEQLNDPDIGPILQDVETGERPELKDIAVRSRTYKSYWAQWKSLAVRNCTIERNWDSANGRSQIAQIVQPRSRLKDVLTERHGGSQGATWVSTRPWISFSNGNTGSRQEAILRDGAKSATPLQPVPARGLGIGLKMHQYNIGDPFERIAIDVAGPFPGATKETNTI
jgi:hypothetical protein